MDSWPSLGKANRLEINVCICCSLGTSNVNRTRPSELVGKIVMGVYLAALFSLLVIEMAILFVLVLPLPQRMRRWPVSYTHLDVYKRQVLRYAQRKGTNKI